MSTYRLSWKATNQYSMDLTEGQLRDLAEQVDFEIDGDLDEEKLDELYSVLDSNDWRANEAFKNLHKTEIGSVSTSATSTTSPSSTTLLPLSPKKTER